MSRLPEVHDRLREMYGDLSVPTFSRVEIRYHEQPYAALLSRLSKSFVIEETTDLNDDVAVVVAATRDGQTYGLRLSLVGPYAALSAPDGRVLDVEEVSELPVAREIAAHLADAGVAVLGRTFLVTDVAFGAPDGKAPLYELLFSADEAIWNQT